MIVSGSLFTGLGLLDEAIIAVYGRARLAWFAEHDPADERRAAYCRAVVGARHPDALDLGDVCAIDGRMLPAVDVLCLGFPCQDISPAGGGAGLAGARSGLWAEVPRILGEMAPERRPNTIIIENSGNLSARGLAVVLRDLAALGYGAGWQVIGAVGVGAPHRRERCAVIATRGGMLPVWPDLAPWRARWLSGWWTPEREPERVTAPALPTPGLHWSLDPAVAWRQWRIDAVAALGNGVVRPWAEYVATAARDAAPPVRDLLGALDARGMPWSDRLPPAGVMWQGRLYEAARVYGRTEAEADVLASRLCQIYGALLPTPRRSDHRSGATSEATAAKNSRPLCEVATALLPTPTASGGHSNRGGAAGREGQPERLTLHGLARRGVLLPTPVMLPTPTRRDHRSGAVAGSSSASRDAAGGFRRLTDDVVAMSKAAALLATPTRCGNYNRRGASAASGDGLATQAGAMDGERARTLLLPGWVAWLQGWSANVVPLPWEIAVAEHGVGEPDGHLAAAGW